MAVKKKPVHKLPSVEWLSSDPAQELTPAQTLAHAMVIERPDLTPSVAKIMVAELGPEATVRALELFQHALTTPGDVHRDPRIAIERSRKP